MAQTRWIRTVLAGAAVALLAGCEPEVTRQDGAGGILLIGDDFFATNGATLTETLAAQTGRPVFNLADPQARMTHPRYPNRLIGREVVSQFTAAAYDWVVITGGAQDVLRECRCKACDDTLDEIVGLTGRGGALPPLVARATRGQAKVLLVGYAPGTTEPGCQDEIRELNSRFSRLADLRSGVSYLATARTISPETPAFYAGTVLSPNGTSALAALIADTIGLR